MGDRGVEEAEEVELKLPGVAREPESASPTDLPRKPSTADGAGTLLHVALRPDPSAAGLTAAISGGSALGRPQNQEAVSFRQQALLAGVRRMEQIATMLGLTRDVVVRGVELYTRVEDSGVLRARQTTAVLVACLVFACRDALVPRTIKELCAVADVRKRDVSRAVTRIKQANLHVGPAAYASTTDVMARFCSRLKLPASIERVAVVIADRAKSLLALRLGSTNAASIAGAAIFLAAHVAPDAENRRSLDDVASATLMSPPTIRSCFAILHPLRYS